ncbi:hypothetical protein DPMN_170829 [Dreissena polymorpha]|uniref:CCHC-type domain-containing protein n=1 Tax=Dreissena polymorpha TaxID=45954 RepID=A0A9D4DZ56_DREPO|nr:hypothetical protein DPMN_170829 [Dreissena polymorpha]
MRLRIKQARPVSLNDAIRHAVELEAFYRAERTKPDRHVSAVGTDDNKPMKQMNELQKMVDMLSKQLNQFMGTAETSKPRYGSRPSVMERRCYTCGSKSHLKRKCPDNGGFVFSVQYEPC